MIDFDSLTVGDVKRLASLVGGLNGARPMDETAFEVGKAYLIRTPTMHHIGRVVRITPTELVLDDCGWLADSGRFGECIAKGTYNEYEPMGDGVIVPRINVVDATIWRHKMPKEAK